MPRFLRSPRSAALRTLLVQARQKAGLTQADLAGRLRRPQSFVSKVEAGERRLDFVEFLEVTQALGYQATDIIAALLAIEG